MSRIVAFAFLLLLAPTLQANVIAIGVLSFDVLVPADAGPGVNGFTISNYTGDPASGGAAIPPDFDVFTALLFANATLTLGGDVNQIVPLPDISPGPFNSSDLQFPDNLAFSSAVVDATLSQLSFLLSGGGTFTADSGALQTTLSPLNGASLVAGTDFAVIYVSGTVTDGGSPVPEPATFGMVLGVLGCFLVRQLRS